MHRLEASVGHDLARFGNRRARVMGLEARAEDRAQQFEAGLALHLIDQFRYAETGFVLERAENVYVEHERVVRRSCFE